MISSDCFSLFTPNSDLLIRFSLDFLDDPLLILRQKSPVQSKYSFLSRLREKVSVGIEGHFDRGVPKLALNILARSDSVKDS